MGYRQLWRYPFFTIMNRRKFLLATATATLFPSAAIARRFRVQENESDLPVIRMHEGVIVNPDFVFENVQWKRNESSFGGVVEFKFERTTVAWLNEHDSQSYIKIDDSKGYVISDGLYWGKVIVKQFSRVTDYNGWRVSHGPTCWIEKIPVSYTK